MGNQELPPGLLVPRVFGLQVSTRRESPGPGLSNAIARSLAKRQMGQVVSLDLGEAGWWLGGGGSWWVGEPRSWGYPSFPLKEGAKSSAFQELVNGRC